MRKSKTTIGGVIMNKDNQDLYHQFLRDLTESEDSVEKLREALSGVAYYYHMCGMEAEIIGGDESEHEKYLLYENSDASVEGEPLKFTQKLLDEYNFVIYLYAADKPFTDEEKDELELYALNCGFVFEKHKLMRYL